MVDYIVCHKKRNAPRVHIRVCRERCPFKDSCKEYLATARPHPDSPALTTHREEPSAPAHPA